MTIYKPVEWPKYAPIKNSKKLKFPQQTEGHWVTEGHYQYNVGETIAMIVFALFWGLGGPAFVLTGLLTVRGGGWYGVSFILVGLVWAAVAVHLFWTNLRNTVRAKKERELSPPTLLLPAEQLCPGETARVTFQRELKGGKELAENGQLHARLLRVEVTHRRVGTDTTYDHHFLSEVPLATQGVFAGQTHLSVTWHLTLPPDAQPNVISDGHWVFWQLQILQELPPRAPMLSEFMLPVKWLPPHVPTLSDLTLPVTPS